MADKKLTAGSLLHSPQDRDQLAHESIVRPLVTNLFGEPGGEAVSAVDDESSSDPHVGSGQAFRKIIVVVRVRHERRDPGMQPVALGGGFQPANLF